MQVCAECVPVNALLEATSLKVGAIDLALAPPFLECSCRTSNLSSDQLTDASQQDNDAVWFSHQAKQGSFISAQWLKAVVLRSSDLS